MKKSFCLLVLILSTLTLFSQVDRIPSSGNVNDSIYQFYSKLESEGFAHFTFKGIPIDGSSSQFIDKLIEKGFALKGIRGGVTFLNGKFAGEEVRVCVETTPDIFYQVMVIYDEKYSWKSIKTQYNDMKLMLIEKYGEPTDVIEKFESLDYEKTNMEFFALREDKCTYMSNFMTNEGNGMIRLSISSNACLILNYVDVINFLKARAEVYEDL